MKKFYCVLSLALALMLVLSACSGSAKVGTVNSEKITLGEYKFMLAQYKAAALQQLGLEQAEEDTWETKEIEGKKAGEYVREKTLEELIALKLEVSKAKEMNIELTRNEELSADKDKESIIESYGGQTSYNQMLSDVGITDSELGNLIHQVRLAEKLQNYIMENDEEMKNITDEEVAKYSADKIKAEHILFLSTPQGQGTGDPEYAQKAKEKAQSVLDQIKAGANFEELMKQYSEDPGLSQYPDGYVFGKGEMVKEFEDAAYALEPGQVTQELVETTYGYHIIKRVPITKGDDIVKNGKYKDLVAKWKESAKINIDQNAINSVTL